ncbi:MAG: hypothetical protein SF162_12325 [bacterium]|nr:hypothetical protein [bacterium]
MSWRSRIQRPGRGFAVAAAALIAGAVFGVGNSPSAAAQIVNQPYVVFIEEPRVLQTASLTDPGPDGLTRLAEIFQAYGAATGFLPLDTPIPPEADLIVLARPRGALPAHFLARLYAAMDSGANLMLALDPAVHQGARPDGAASGLNALLNADYGVSLVDVFLVEPYFTARTVTELRRSYSLAVPGDVPNPVIDPLQRYDIPVQLWGARALDAAGYTFLSRSFPLAQAEPAYGERDPNFFLTPTPQTNPTPTPLPEGARTPVPPGYQIDLDRIGVLSVGVMGENLNTGSRVIVFADGEMLQNGFGLGVSAVNGLPLNVGNRILVERAAGWLLDLDSSEYLPLPDGFTLLAVDGDGGDWADDVAAVDDPPGDTGILGLDILQVRAFRNRYYLHIRIDTAAPASRFSEIAMRFDADQDGEIETTVTVSPAQVIANQDGVIGRVEDAAAAFGTIIEIRLPLRVTGAVESMPNLCLLETGDVALPQPPDCADVPIPVSFRPLNELAPLRLPADMLARAATEQGVNVRAGAFATAAVLLAASDRDVFSVTGRSADFQWLEVENAAVRGWVNVQAVFANGDIDALPVVDVE